MIVWKKFRQKKCKNKDYVKYAGNIFIKRQKKYFKKK